MQQSFRGPDVKGLEGSYEATAGDSSTERLIMQELEMKNGLEAMLTEQRMTAEKYKANFSLLEAQHIQLQSETQQLKDDLAQNNKTIQNCEKKYENQIYSLQSERDSLLLDIENLKTKIMTPAKLENLRQNLLRDVEMIYKQHLSQTEDEVDSYRKELNKLKFDYNFMRTEYENCQNEYAQKLEDVHAKYRLDIDTLQRKNDSLKKTVEQKGLAAQESVSLIKENTKLAAKVKALLNENEAYRKQITEETRRSDERVAKVSTQLSELHVKHEIVSNENKSVLTRVEKLQDKLEQSNNDLTKQIPHIAKLEDQVLRLTSDIDDINQKHKMEMTLAENNFKRQLSDAHKEADDTKAQLTDSHTKIDFMTKTVEQLKASLRSKEKDYGDKLQVMKDQQWDSLNRTKQEQAALEAKLTSAEKQHSEQIYQLNLELEKSKSSSETVLCNMQTLSKEKENLSSQINKLQSTLESKEKDLKYYQRVELDAETLQSQLKSANKQYKEEVIENDKVKAQLKLANEEITELRSQVKDLKLEFEQICQTNQGTWEKENEVINDKYQSLKKRITKGEKRRETILNLAKKQKSQHQKEVSALKDTIICCQAREKQNELEKESLRKNHELEMNRLRRQIDSFKIKATEFESLLYNPLAGEGSGSGVNTTLPMPEAFSSILASTKEQQHELAELRKNLDEFQEKREELEKVV